MSPKWVPQFSDSSEVFAKITKKDDVSYPVLVPNQKGFEAAVSQEFYLLQSYSSNFSIRCDNFFKFFHFALQLAVGVKEIAVFAAASESFSQKNINCSITESIERFRVVLDNAIKNDIKVRGYVSTVAGCPYEGPIKPQAVASVAEKLLDLGCYEISLGDTIGVGTYGSMSKMLTEVLNVTTADKLAIHCHNTYGQALPNILTALNAGIKVIDSSVSGLGGCPYAKGASGNVPTEDIVYMLQGYGVYTGINLPELVLVGRFICEYLGKKSDSKITLAMGDLKPLTCKGNQN